MNADTGAFAAQARELRRIFDESFAALTAPQAQGQETLIALRINGDRFALRTSQIAGIAKCGKIVQVPARAPALLGLAGIRGELVPVFSINLLMGYGDAAEHSWMVLCETPVRAGLAFSDFDGCFKVSASAFSHAAQREDQLRSTEVVAINSLAHLVVDVNALTGTIAREQERQQS